VLPKGGIARFHGTARLFKSGPVYEEVWTRLIRPEKDRDPDKKGFACSSRWSGRKNSTAPRLGWIEPGHDQVSGSTSHESGMELYGVGSGKPDVLTGDT
jgi:hypothetical protein